MDQFPADVLPPEGTYNSHAALLAAIQTWTKSRGYAFTTEKSLKTLNGRTRIIFACNRRGRPTEHPIEQIRRTTSRRVGCRFSVLAKESLDKNVWVLSHRPDQACAQHNHLPSPSASVHHIHRQLRKSDSTIIAGLIAAGSKPQKIRTYLYNTSETLFTQQDIYNEIKAVRKDQRQGRNSTEALLGHLREKGFWYRVDVDEDNRLIRLFFAHLDALVYL